MTDISIAVSVIDGRYTVQLLSYEPISPFYYHHNGDYYVLDNSIAAWMFENNIDYTLSYNRFADNPNRWIIFFKNKKDAVLYKLVWG